MEFPAALISWTSSSWNMSHCSFKCFLSSCCSSTFKLSSIFTSMAFHDSISYCGLLIFVCLSPYFLIFPLFLHEQFFLLSMSMSIHDMLINMIHTCDCLHPFYFWPFCNLNFPRAQWALCGYDLSSNFFIQNVWLHVIGFIAAVISWTSTS